MSASCFREVTWSQKCAFLHKPDGQIVEVSTQGCKGSRIYHPSSNLWTFGQRVISDEPCRNIPSKNFQLVVENCHSFELAPSRIYLRVEEDELLKIFEGKAEHRQGLTVITRGELRYSHKKRRRHPVYFEVNSRDDAVFGVSYKRYCTICFPGHEQVILGESGRPMLSFIDRGFAVIAVKQRRDLDYHKIIHYSSSEVEVIRVRSGSAWASSYYGYAATQATRLDGEHLVMSFITANIKKRRIEEWETSVRLRKPSSNIRSLGDFYLVDDGGIPYRIHGPVLALIAYAYQERKRVETKFRETLMAISGPSASILPQLTDIILQEQETFGYF